MSSIRRTHPQWLGLLKISIGWCRITLGTWFSTLLQPNGFSKMVLRFFSASSRRLEKVSKALSACLWSVLALSHPLTLILSPLLSFFLPFLLFYLVSLPDILWTLFFLNQSINKEPLLIKKEKNGSLIGAIMNIVLIKHIYFWNTENTDANGRDGTVACIFVLILTVTCMYKRGLHAISGSRGNKNSHYALLSNGSRRVILLSLLLASVLKKNSEKLDSQSWEISAIYEQCKSLEKQKT